MSMNSQYQQTNRIGQFTVSRQAVEDAPWKLSRVFSGFVPKVVDYDLATDSLCYMGWSPWFIPLDEGHDVPEYLYKITEDGVVIWQRKDA